MIKLTLPTRDNAFIGVLVVDDEPMFAMALEDCLRDLGFTWISCTGILGAGRRSWPSEAPGLGVLDVNVRKTLVFPLAAELQVRRVTFFLSSGLSRDGFPPEWNSHAFVAKLLRPYALKATLQDLGFKVWGDNTHQWSVAGIAVGRPSRLPGVETVTYLSAG